LLLILIEDAEEAQIADKNQKKNEKKFLKEQKKDDDKIGML